MPGRHWLVLALGATALVATEPVHAAITAYTDRAAFLANLAPGYYEETGMAGAYPNYSGGAFTYEVNASNTPFPGPNSSDLSTTTGGGPITFLSFSPGIKAFGGYFYNVNYDNIVAASPIQIQLNDGSSFTYTTPTDGANPSSATSFYGFISDSSLISASVTATTSPVGCTEDCLYPTVGSVIVGTTGGGSTPAPAPAPLLGAVAAFGASRRLRRRLLVR